MLALRFIASVSDELTDWQDRLGELIKETKETKGQIAIAPYGFSVREVQGAPFCGAPFVIAAESAKICEAINGLSSCACSVLTEHAYAWIVTDTRSKVAAALASRGLRDIPVLEWSGSNQYSIVSRLAELARFPHIGGLSTKTHETRISVRQVAHGRNGPWRPVLIVGESGSGKEGVARALHAMSDRATKPFEPIACGQFDDIGIQHQILGIEGRRYPEVPPEGVPGMFETITGGTLFFDDCDAAPPSFQGILLRLMSTEKGKPHVFFRYGDGGREHPRETMTWPLMSTNAPIARLIKEGKWREDFVFRFEWRVIRVAPLRERYADIPALCTLFWDDVTQDWPSAPPPRFSPNLIEWLVNRRLAWNGNARTLKGLLGLIAMRKRFDASTSLLTLLEEVLARGETYEQWVDLDRRRASPDSSIASVLALDESDDTTKAGKTSGSERRALAIIGTPLQTCLATVKPTKAGALERGEVRLCRIVCLVQAQGKVTLREAAQLARYGKGQTTVKDDLDRLVKAGILAHDKGEPFYHRGAVWP